MDDPDLDAAYALKTPDDNRALYANWADSYDSSFADEADYRLPQIVAFVLADVMRGSGPVLDVGAGTGLVAQNIPDRDALEIDALDISPEMLAQSAKKGLYRAYIEADLTKPVDIPDEIYGAVVSAGTFTHGHVGPEAIDTLLRIAKPGAVFVLSINSEHFSAHGFEAKFAAIESEIAQLDFRILDIYGPSGPPEHQNDKAHIAVFRKRPV
ncbi:Methyltransferase type 11 [Sulfitobacter noctilucicola]|uniref:Putative TPR repeat methyltransferase n=1 Tax=Sulfitobacter noctilucicola TaxID=1342301 RepID=A0A7W6Q4E1_9RHOB|nr:class I SAM-dependent methyltransferase [Sulfitobacter noctilucicola]KIN62644.1 Methyltransferase type 11 [Sulfitobacter noctilucicola]MBB4172822.1 putative TPR repeat methyltransferase [Sulfitobacter noctilucicola]